MNSQAYLLDLSKDNWEYISSNDFLISLKFSSAISIWDNQFFISVLTSSFINCSKGGMETVRFDSFSKKEDILQIQASADLTNSFSLDDLKR